MSDYLEIQYENYLRSWEAGDYENDLMEQDCDIEELPAHLWINGEGRQIDLRRIGIRYARNIKRFIEERELDYLAQYKFVCKRIKHLEQKDPLNLL